MRRRIRDDETSGTRHRHRAAAAAAAQAFASADAHRAHVWRRHVSVIAVAPRGRAVASRHALASTEAARAQDRCQVSPLAAGIAEALAAIHAFCSADAARVQVGFCHVSPAMLFMFDAMRECGSVLVFDLFVLPSSALRKLPESPGNLSGSRTGGTAQARPPDGPPRRIHGPRRVDGARRRVAHGTGQAHNFHPITSP